MTTFGTRQPAGGKPAFGKKTAPSPAGRALPAPKDRLSPEALAFLTAERARAPAQPAQPSYATPKAAASPSAYGAGKPVWGRRIVARLVDELGVWLLIYLIFRDGLSAAVSTYITAGAGTPAENAAAVSLFGYAVIFMLAQSAYNIVMEASSTQATLGKMMMGAVVTNREGGRPSLGGVILRNTAGRFVSNILPLYIGYLMGLFNRERRCIHDMMSGTVVRQRTPAGAPASYGEVFA